MKLTEHAERNRVEWDKWAAEYVDAGRRAWAQNEISWGIVDVHEDEVGAVGEVDGLDVLELGCGTAYVSAWLARRGARVVGLDLSERQLESARTFQQEFGPEFPLVRASGEDVPFPDESFDLIVSEYGVCLWADPYRWVPEAARLLRPGGRLSFLTNGTLLMLTMPDEEEEIVPAGEQLLRDYFGMHRFEWKTDDSVDFHLGYGDWIRLFRANGLEVEDLVELRGRPDAELSRHNLFTPEWASRWPAEEVWKVRKPA